MKKILLVAMLFWLIHFVGEGLDNPLKVDKINGLSDDYYGRRAYFTAQKGKINYIIPWFQVLYIEEIIPSTN